eukprot:5323353-Pyramimonas_sp.AAC.1
MSPGGDASTPDRPPVAEGWPMAHPRPAGGPWPMGRPCVADASSTFRLLGQLAPPCRCPSLR